MRGDEKCAELSQLKTGKFLLRRRADVLHWSERGSNGLVCAHFTEKSEEEFTETTKQEPEHVCPLF